MAKIVCSATPVRLRVLLGVLIVAGCKPERELTQTAAATGKSPEGQAVAAMTASHWLGSDSCRDCHAKYYEQYQSHPMANSFASIQTTTRPENYSNSEFHTDPLLSYFVTSNQESRVFHHEKRETKDGKVIYDQAVAIDFVVGSCAHGRSYLTNSEGRFYQSPITWYTRDQKWDLSPGYPRDFHERFDRRVTHACVVCHAGRTIPHETDPDRFAAQPFGEMTIGCERCHGPGQDHVRLHREGNVSKEADPIINPGAMSPERLDAVCNQCHLAGERRVLKSGHTEFDFRPGMLLTDLWTVFVKRDALSDGAIGAVSHVEQMYSSGCYSGSERKMTCIACHDPHSIPTRETKHEYYRQKCIECHSSGQSVCTESEEVRRQQPERDSCIVCHMPMFSASNVHSAQTDHRILRRPSSPKDGKSGVAKADGDKSERLIFEEPGAVRDPRELTRAQGIYLAERAYLGGESDSAKEAIRFLEADSKLFADDVEVQFALGRAYYQEGQLDKAIASLKQAQKLSPNHEDVLQTLASLYHEAGKLRLARSAYERLLKVNPTRSRYYGRYTHVLGQLDEVREGIDAANKALELNPSLVQTHQWLVDAYTKRGNQEAAWMHEQIVNLFKQSGAEP